MSKSLKRVEEAARKAGLDLEIRDMPDSTRTAQDAAQACGCAVGQIVKSLIFQGQNSKTLKLLLVSGDHNVDLEKAAGHIGEPLVRADPKIIREQTGFAIGGVSPIGHKNPIETWFDTHLLSYETVWAAAGTPHAVFQIIPQDLLRLTLATKLDVV